jgi:hypothetical protein
VDQGQIDRPLQGERFGTCGDREAEAQTNHQPAGAHTNTIAIDHCVTLGTGKSEKTENTSCHMSAKDSQMCVSRGIKISQERSSEGPLQAAHPKLVGRPKRGGFIGLPD